MNSADQFDADVMQAGVNRSKYKDTLLICQLVLNLNDKRVDNIISRRTILKTGSLVTGGFMIVPRHVLGKGYTAPSDKLSLAAIGSGGKGRSDIINAWNKGSENVVALCDVDRERAGETLKKFPKARFYADFRVMLDELGSELDAVTISTPDHTHAVAAMAAMDLGLHIYVQKPLTHNIYEARMLTEKAREQSIVSQMGNQGASNPGQEQMIKWFDEGVIGKVHEAQIWTNRPVWPQGIPLPKESSPLPETMTAHDWDLFIGPASMVDYHPLYHPFKWRGWWNFGTGALGDMGCHLIDPAFRVLRLGYPLEVECSVGQVFLQDWVAEHIPEGCPPSSRVQLKFPANEYNDSQVLMSWHDGGLRPFHPQIIPPSDPIGDDDSANGVILIGEKGVMTCGTYGVNPRIYLNSGEKITMPKNFSGSNEHADKPEYGHHIHWAKACKAGFGSPEHQALTSSFDYAGPLTETVLMGNLAIRSYSLASDKKDRRGRHTFEGRKKLLWDGHKMTITNFDPANQFVRRAYRDGWKL